MNKLKRSLAAKTGAMILLVLMLWVVVGSVVMAVGLFEFDVYASPASARYLLLSTRAENDSRRLISYFYAAQLDSKGTIDVHISPDQQTLLWLSESNMSFRVERDGVEVFNNLPADADSYPTSSCFDLSINHYIGSDDVTDESQQGLVNYTVTARLDPNLPHHDSYRLISRLFDAAVALRYAVYVIAFAALVACVFLVVFLVASVGHRPGTDEPDSVLGHIPFDITTIVAAFIAFIGVAFMVEFVPSFSASVTLAALFCCGSVLAVVCMVYVMSFAACVKLRTLWRGSLTCLILRLLWRGLCAVGRGLRAAGRGIAAFFRAIPLVWRAALGCGALWLWLFIVSVITSHMSRVLIMLGTATLLVIFGIWCAIMLHRLCQAAERLARGELETTVSVNGMAGDMRCLGENLNRISGGMSVAVDERMKSERFKTELITNVSHDLKTPLTSIINYSDLIAREPTDNQKIREYATVLTRQSERLKNLIVDLVEASKAATGSVELEMAPCEIGVLVTQAAGEYQTRLEANGLTLVSDIPRDGLRITADAPRLWRVLDNLMGNALKYSQPGTRVYLTLKAADGRVLITIKNTSRTQLNIPAEELMERFVRGDSSRHTEGNGLGLSIARSLTELMGGELRLDVDGDLFKATLDFPEIK